jgi:hypothetical protein
MDRKTTKTTVTPKNAKPTQKPVSGKLGIIAKAIATPKGATLEELRKKTNWQPHTVRAALSRLRKRDIPITLESINERKAYRSTPAGA